jgi:hypothetical protein
VTPVLQALVLAERIYEDKHTGRKIIAGTMRHVTLIKKDEATSEKIGPSGESVTIVRGGIAGSPFAYVSLTGVFDETVLTLQFVSLTRNKVMFVTKVTVRCKDRLETVEIVSALPELGIPEPGVYAFEVICEGEILGSTRLVARVKSEDPEPDSED